MDIQPQTTQSQPISDDQELAKVLAGVTDEANNLQFEETPVSNPVLSGVPQTPVADTPPLPTPDQITPPASESPIGYNPPGDTPVVAPAPEASPAPRAVDSGLSDLDSIKKDALSELRPLVDKLDLSPEEKFDTYLLLLRSTDDKALIAPAHAAAKSIADESRRAQALLDVIKEIDFLSNPQPTA